MKTIIYLSILALAGLTSTSKMKMVYQVHPLFIKRLFCKPSLVTTLSGLMLLKSIHLLAQTTNWPDSGTVGAQPDGAGLMKNPSGEGFIFD